MSNTILNVGAEVDFAEVGEFHLEDDVKIVAASVAGTKLGSQAAVMAFQKKASEQLKKVNLLKQLAMKDLPTADVFTKKIASEAKSVQHLQMVPRTRRTFSPEQAKGRRVTFAGRDVFPLLNRWTFTVCQVRGDMVPAIAKAIAKAEPGSTLPAAALAATDYVFASGPSVGFVKRYIQGVNSPKKYQFKKEHVSLVMDDFVLQASVSGLWDETFDTRLSDLKYNRLSSAGYPYDVSKDATVKVEQNGSHRSIPLLAIITADARAYWSAASSFSTTNALTKFYEQEPGHQVFQLKNKFERVKVDEVGEKVRPYYVPPSAPAMVWMMLAQYLKKHTLNVIDVIDLGLPLDTTSNCVGISWASGGCTKFWRQIFAMPNNSMLFFTYTDDGLWVAHLNGRFFGACVDIKHLDASQSADFGKLGEMTIDSWVELGCEQMGREKTFPPAWRNVLRDGVRQSYTGPYVAFKEVVLAHDGLHSGTSLTTLLNQIATALPTAEIKRFSKDYLSLPPGEGNEREWLGLFTDEAVGVAEAHGLEYKKETLKWIEFNKRDLTGLEFLGMHFYAEGEEGAERYYPALAEAKVLSSLWCEKPIAVPAIVSDTKMYKIRVQMEQLRAYALVGGYRYPDTFKLLRKVFIDLRTEFMAKPVLGLFDHDEEFLLVPNLGQFLSELNDGTTPLFPTVDWCKAVYDGRPREKLSMSSEDLEVEQEKGAAKAASFWYTENDDDPAVSQKLPPGLAKVEQKLKNRPPTKLAPPREEMPIYIDEKVVDAVHARKLPQQGLDPQVALMARVKQLERKLNQQAQAAQPSKPGKPGKDKSKGGKHRHNKKKSGGETD